MKRPSDVAGRESPSHPSSWVPSRYVAPSLASTLPPGALVILTGIRSSHLVDAMLALHVQAAGFTWIDPEWPIERQWRARQLLSVGFRTSEHSFLGFEVLEPILPQWRTEMPTAYVIFTSGSTGEPKAVRVTHGNVRWLYEAWSSAFSTLKDERCFAVTSFSFDPFVVDLLVPLVHGCYTVLASDAQSRGRTPLLRTVLEHDITYMAITPTRLRLLLDEARFVRTLPLRRVVVGGEPLHDDLVRAACDYGIRVFNAYGPTECTVACFVGESPVGRSISIGHPLRGVEAYISNEGELVVSGPCVSGGYLAPVPGSDRFDFSNGAPSYRTGDRVVTNDLGEFVFLGRIDRQVKVRGFRVELGEVETVARNVPGVDACVAAMTHDDENLALVACVSSPQEHERVLGSLARAFERHLPSYMRPTIVRCVSTLPTTVGGKLDVSKILESPTHENSWADEPLMRAWQSALRNSQPIPDGATLREFGGHSLTLVEIIAALELQGVRCEGAGLDTPLGQWRTLAASAGLDPTVEPNPSPDAWLLPTLPATIFEFGALDVVGGLDFVMEMPIAEETLRAAVDAVVVACDALRTGVRASHSGFPEACETTVPAYCQRLELEHGASSASTLAQLQTLAVSKIDAQKGPLVAVIAVVDPVTQTTQGRLLSAFHVLDPISMQEVVRRIRVHIERPGWVQPLSSQQRFLRAALLEFDIASERVARKPRERPESVHYYETVVRLKAEDIRAVTKLSGLHRGAFGLTFAHQIASLVDLPNRTLMTAVNGRFLVGEKNASTVGRLAHYVAFNAEKLAGLALYDAVRKLLGDSPERCALRDVVAKAPHDASQFCGIDVFCEFAPSPKPMVLRAPLTMTNAYSTSVCVITETEHGHWDLMWQTRVRRSELGAATKHALETLAGVLSEA